jgi:mRNA-degrading endonuclease YafQ of YafQ-DinJ toxin-antitoxin module
MQIIYTSQFYHRYKKLSDEVKALTESKEKIFRKDPFNSVLKTHKLHGDFKEFWAFSINAKCRIIFEFGGKDKVYFHSIGNHDIYD